jgi:hypothetical protein
MCASHQDVSFGFTEQKFPAGGHICYIYTSEEERRDFIARFIESGLASGERVAYLTDTPHARENNPTVLSTLGVHLPPALKPNQLFVAEAEPVYCPDGLFTPDRMLDRWRDFYRQSCAEHFPGVRVTGETTWLRKDVPGIERWFEYEARLNWTIGECPYTGILCQYDANRLDGAALYEVLNVHPLMIVRGQVMHNPYYEPPEQYLAKHGVPIRHAR